MIASSVRVSAKIDAALEYVTERGWAVFPLQPGTKVPFPGTHAVYDATKDVRAIRRWNPRWEIAIACGRISNLLVIDLDPRNGGDQSWAEWTQKHGELTTLTAITGGGGRHLYLRYPGTRDYVKTPLPGVDVIRDGFYVVGVPSTVGQGYRWLDESVPICEASPALLELITRKRQVVPRRRKRNPQLPELEARIKRASHYVDRMPPAISGQRGHDATFKVALVLVRGFLLPEHLALDLLRDYSARCVPPWSDKELKHKIDSAARPPTERDHPPVGWLLDEGAT
jgi:hypothetical protein